MKTLCYSVRLESLVSISDKAYRATAFDGSTAIIPKSQVFGQDYEVKKSEAYWISAWILEKKTIQYSNKKEGVFNFKKNKIEKKCDYEIEFHRPEILNPIENNIINQLKK